MTSIERLDVLAGGSPIDDREARLATGADELVEGRRRPSILRHERFLLTLAAALMSLGVSMILLGWFGAARSTFVEEQVPYLISGGLLGVALAVIGGLTFFTHWLTVLVREARAHEAARRQDHEELVTALRSLTTAVAREGSRQEERNGAGSERPERPVRRASRRT